MGLVTLTSLLLVSDDGTGSGGSAIWTLYGDQAIAQAGKTTTLQDLNADGIAGVNVTNTLSIRTITAAIRQQSRPLRL